MGYIYCITNLINSKRYVGKTTDTIEERFKKHCLDSKKKRCEKRPLYSAFIKYGIENFIIEELEYVEDDNLLSNKEIYWICCKDIVYKVTKANGIKLRNGGSKLIALYDLAGNYIQTFWGANDAKEWLYEHNITSGKRADAHIHDCVTGKLKTAFGYIWKQLPEPI